MLFLVLFFFLFAFIVTEILVFKMEFHKLREKSYNFRENDVSIVLELDLLERVEHESEVAEPLLEDFVRLHGCCQVLREFVVNHCS